MGDGLEIHHAPQAHVAEQVSPAYSRVNEPAIALPRAEHQAMPTIRGSISINPRAMLAQEVSNLRNFTNATNQHIQSWLDTAKDYFGVK